jgi:hypothetical protein
MNAHNADTSSDIVFPEGPLSSPEWVRAIIENPDATARNLQITQSYHQFTVDFAARSGVVDVCWCGFATWASKQAGRFIRGEQIPPALLDALGLNAGGESTTTRPWYWFLLPKWLLRSPSFLSYARMSVEDTSRHIAEGNRLVYSKLAPIFASFFDWLGQEPRPTPERLDAFLEGLAADLTPHNEIRQAFSAYYQALFETDEKIKAELILHANILIGLHEQIRLQEAIEGALRAPIQRALDDPKRRLHDMPVPLFIRQAIAAIFKWVFGAAIQSLEARWLRVATQGMMTLATPGGALRLGDDVPPLSDGHMYPGALRQLSYPPLIALIEEWDYTPSSISGSGAKDWSSLRDRLNYIIDLFRSRQQATYMAAPPFSAEQAAAIQKGEAPSGPL